MAYARIIGFQYIPSGSTIALPLRIGVFRFEAAVLLAELFKEGPRPTVKLRHLAAGNVIGFPALASTSMEQAGRWH